MYECQSKPKIRINFESPDGNIFVVLASAANAIKRYNIHNGDKYIAEMNDYEKALEIIREYVDIET